MTQCPACERANTNPSTGIYQASCLGCEARAIAQSPEAHRREGAPGDMEAAMRRTWPEIEQYRKGRSLVWGWIKRKEVSNG